MATPAQEIFKRIILFNKLLSEEQINALLTEIPEPEKAVQRLVQQQVLSAKMASDLMGIYRQQVAQVSGQPAAGSPTPPPPAPAAAPAQAPAAQAKAPAPPGQQRPGKELVHRFLKLARDAKASDIHIKSGNVPVARINGQLRDLRIPPLDAATCEQALLSILNEKQRKQFLETNDIDFCYDSGTEIGRFRTSFFRQQDGVDGVFRLIANRVPTFEELGLSSQVKKFTDYRQGIVMVTGPKGCGKTTTLAAMVDWINQHRPEHIITIEDPIEFIHPCKKAHVNQREVGAHTGSFSHALRASLREAPDVIVVGELRDLETTQLAISAAETGHLVLSTLHTPNAIRTIGRVLDVFPPKQQSQIRTMLSESLRGVISQELIQSADGKSMQLAIEILVNTPASGNLIREDRAFQLRSVMQTGKRLGMVLMDESLIELAMQGRISKVEALTRAEDVSFVQGALAPKKKKWGRPVSS